MTARLIGLCLRADGTGAFWPFASCTFTSVSLHEGVVGQCSLMASQPRDLPTIASKTACDKSYLSVHHIAPSKMTGRKASLPVLG
jgi:hypothetical protein